MQGYLARQAVVQGNLVLHQKQIVQIVKAQSIAKISQFIKKIIFHLVFLLDDKLFLLN